MITRKTVFVLGAGASHPYGFPLASGMIIALCEHETSYTHIVREERTRRYGERRLLHPTFTPPRIKKFSADLTSSALESIDAFLTARPEYAEIGKAAIAATLVPYENPGSLRKPKNGQWYGYLRNRMGEAYEDFCTSAELDFVHHVA
jgi:hypothetical protein